ncbi:MAG: hypothetical protein V1704_04570 [Candidatus Vogelbacteria bacterium]
MSTPKLWKNKIDKTNKIGKFFVAICLVLLAFPHSAGAFKRIFLTSGDPGTWTVVSDWSAVNTIETIGAGGGGGDGAGAGGGGGAYAAIANLSSLTIGTAVTYQVGTTTSNAVYDADLETGNGVKGGDTFLVVVVRELALIPGTRFVLKVALVDLV